MDFPELGLPAFKARMRKSGPIEQIFDPVRKKFLELTPEEWVRQHFVNLLINHLNYPKGLLQVEKQHQYSSRSKRSDILILDSHGKPRLLVECKAATVDLRQEGLNQLAVYNKTIQAPLICLTNGLHTFVWRTTSNGYEQLKEFPIYEG